MFVIRRVDRLCRSIKHVRNISNKRIGIVGCPFSKGQQLRGPELAPMAIRQAGLVYEMHSNNESLDVQDYGDVEIAHRKYSPEYPKNMRNYGQIVGTVVNLASKVEQVLKDDRIVVTIGGDHSVGIGSIGAHLKHNKDIAVIWVDAHADINTNLTSLSGNIHGMTVALLAKELEPYWPKLPGMEWLENNIYIVASNLLCSSGTTNLQAKTSIYYQYEIKAENILMSKTKMLLFKK